MTFIYEHGLDILKIYLRTKIKEGQEGTIAFHHLLFNNLTTRCRCANDQVMKTSCTSCLRMKIVYNIIHVSELLGVTYDCSTTMA